MEDEPITCELCGDDVAFEDRHEIDQLASDYFCLDTGTIVHKNCFMDSRPSEYIQALKQPATHRGYIEDEYLVPDDHPAYYEGYHEF